MLGARKPTPAQKAQARGQIKRGIKKAIGGTKIVGQLVGGIARKTFTNDNVYDVFPSMRKKKK